MESQRAEFLRNLVAQVDAIDAKRAELQSQKAELMKSAVERQFDRKALKATIGERRMKESDQTRHKSLMDEYRQALGMTPLEALAEAQREAEERRGEPAAIGEILDQAGPAAAAEAIHAMHPPAKEKAPGEPPKARGRRRAGAEPKDLTPEQAPKVKEARSRRETVSERMTRQANERQAAAGNTLQ